MQPHRWLWLTRSRKAAIALCFVAGTLAPATGGALRPSFEPRIHDEFSYLLGADTFAHGRLTNPTPLRPEFFEAPHILVEPSYASKYPPGQALVIALGQILTGRPIAGVWLSCGFFAASLCWMLHAWTSRPWALAMTIVTIALIGTFTYWAQSYLGGMAAATGGALVFGALRRTLVAATPGVSYCLGLGVLILANTRPYEGLLACIPAALVLGHWLFRNTRVTVGRRVRAVVLPVAIMLIAGGAAMARYHAAVTGDWSVSPYTAHTKQYFHQGPFRTSELRTPDRQPPARVQRFYVGHQAPPLSTADIAKFVALNFQDRIWSSIETALWVRMGLAPGTAMWLICLIMVATWRSPWFWFSAATVTLVGIGQSAVWWWFPHYSAPVVPIVLASLAMALQRINDGLARSATVRRAGPLIVVVFGLATAGFVGVRRYFDKVAPPPVLAASGAARPMAPVLTRSGVLERLSAQGGRHVVFVRYAETYSVHDEWVYNPANLDAAPVLLVHDLGDNKNLDLIRAYPGRTAWMAKVSDGSPGAASGLEPYRLH